MRRMLELFSGSKIMSDTFRNHGYDVFTIDYNSEYKPDLIKDILAVSAEEIKELFSEKIDVIWSSPDCTAFSKSSRNLYFNRYGEIVNPKTYYYIDLHKHALQLIRELAPKYFYIENPRGRLRYMDFMRDIPLYTTAYCKYGALQQKITDIFTNHPNPNLEHPCKKGDKCHSSTVNNGNTFGSVTHKHGSFERSVIPLRFCEHIVNISEE